MSAPDIDGIYAALAKLEDRTPEQRRAYRVARAAQRGAEHKVIRPFRSGGHGSRFQRRDAAGRFR